MNKFDLQLPRLALLVAFLLTALVPGCGGGGGGGSNVTAGSKSVLSSGVMTKGSVILNGVHFDDSTAAIIGDNVAKTSAFLKTGMVVKLQGVLNSDGVTGVAQQVKAVSEVRGTIQSVNRSTSPFSFVVIGQTVLLDAQTVLPAGVTSPQDAVNKAVPGTTRVEVFGLRDGSGAIHATLVQLVTDNTLDDYVRGTVSNLIAGNSFVLQPGNVNIDITGATINPPGSSLTNGATVQVHGIFALNVMTLFAMSVDIETIQDPGFHHGKGHNNGEDRDETEMEGFVAGCTASPCSDGVFFVDGQAVKIDASTRFEEGSMTDLIDGARVEIEGNRFDGDTLVAAEIEVKSSQGGSRD